jgi:hypothetical protein
MDSYTSGFIPELWTLYFAKDQEYTDNIAEFLAGLVKTYS